MASLADYRTIRVESDRDEKLKQTLREQADDDFFVVGTLDDGNPDITTLLLSNVAPTTNKRDPDTNNVHFVVEDNVADDNFILIDLSDNMNYPHSFNDFINLENFIIYTDVTSNATFTIQLGFLENVDSVDGQFIEILRIASNNQAGVEREVDTSFAGSGGQLRSEDWLSSYQPNLADFANTNSYQDTTGVSTAPGDGDLVLRVLRGDTNELTISVSITYKSN